MSKSKLGHIPWNKGKTGFIHTEETKQKMRQANLGKKISEETKQKMRLAKLGKKRGKYK